MQKSIFPQKIQKSLCITTKSLYTNSKFQTQLSQKLQRFRRCRKNKKCSIFHDLSEYIIFSYGCKLLDCGPLSDMRDTQMTRVTESVTFVALVIYLSHLV